MKNCDNCTHFPVCQFKSEVMDSTKGFVDFDEPNGANWIKRLWDILAERCFHFNDKK